MLVAQERDSVDVESDEERRPSGHVKISIDESGISVEGDVHTEGGSGEWVYISDERDYREKGQDIVRFGESVFVTADEMVRGDLVVFGADAIIEGRVTGNVVVIGGDLRARSGSEIKGDAVIIGGTIDEDHDAIIHGERIMFEDFLPAGGIPAALGLGDWRFKWIMFPVGLFIKLVLAFLVVLFLRDRVLVSAEHLGSGYFKSFGTGLLAACVGFFGLLVVLIPLFITLIGIPLGILLIMSCVGVFVIAWTVFAYGLGRVVGERLQIESDSPFLAVFIGGVVISLPDLIAIGLGAAHILPLYWAFKVFGGLIRLFAFASGLGALVLGRFGSRSIQSPGGAAPPATGPTAISA